uniref:Uncharacterized protein n=1 Tax=Lutzomyia longipalpis TaxID=7200 RepID=A0A7G3B3X2_LUTLO
MDSMPSWGHIRTTDVPRHTTNPKFRVSSANLNGSSGSRRNSVVLSSTRLRRGSYPLRTPAASLPPANFTRIVFSRYLLRSKIDSFRRFSFSLPSPPAPPEVVGFLLLSAI